MSSILISIKPEYVEKILCGSKKYEYRKVIPKKENVNRLVIYSSFPVKKIVGEAEVLDLLKLPPKELWEITKSTSGITRKFFDSYYKGRKIACAFKLGKVTIYEKELNLSDVGISSAPQSFLYLEDK